LAFGRNPFGFFSRQNAKNAKFGIIISIAAFA